jgi:hypothetical protein
MISVASLSVAGIGSVDFVNFLPPEGFLNNFKVAVEEEMDSAGVEGRRWRLISRQFEPFTVETVAAAGDHSQAVNLKTLYGSLRGELATLILISGGRSYLGRDVKIRSVIAMPVNGELVLSDGSITNAHCLATWSLVFTREGDD